MAERFENLENILPGGANEDVEKKSCRGFGEVRTAGKRKINTFLCRK